MPPRKQPAGKTERRIKESAAKPIRLNDLIPTRDVSGGRRTVFGSVPTASVSKKKTQK